MPIEQPRLVPPPTRTTASLWPASSRSGRFRHRRGHTRGRPSSPPLLDRACAPRAVVEWSTLAGQQRAPELRRRRHPRPARLVVVPASLLTNVSRAMGALADLCPDPPRPHRWPESSPSADPAHHSARARKASSHRTRLAYRSSPVRSPTGQPTGPFIAAASYELYDPPCRCAASSLAVNTTEPPALHPRFRRSYLHRAAAGAARQMEK